MRSAQKTISEWLKEAANFWGKMAAIARERGVVILLENHGERSAWPIIKLLDEVGSENLKACFDIGHFEVFGEKKASLFLRDYPRDYIKEVHLSDNMGDRDAHLPLGRGRIDFESLFNTLGEMGVDPVFTIEAKDAWGVIGGFRYLKKSGRL